VEDVSQTSVDAIKAADDWPRPDRRDHRRRRHTALDTPVGEMADGEWLDDARAGPPVVVLGSLAADRLGITDVGDGVRCSAESGSQ
jgi:putative ABC transport system permease protein